MKCLLAAALTLTLAVVASCSRASSLADGGSLVLGGHEPSEAMDPRQLQMGSPRQAKGLVSLPVPVHDMDGLHLLRDTQDATANDAKRQPKQNVHGSLAGHHPAPDRDHTPRTNAAALAVATAAMLGLEPSAADTAAASNQHPVQDEHPMQHQEMHHELPPQLLDESEPQQPKQDSQQQQLLLQVGRGSDMPQKQSQKQWQHKFWPLQPLQQQQDEFESQEQQQQSQQQSQQQQQQRQQQQEDLLLVVQLLPLEQALVMEQRPMHQQLVQVHRVLRGAQQHCWMYVLPMVALQLGMLGLGIAIGVHLKEAHLGRLAASAVKRWEAVWGLQALPRHGTQYTTPYTHIPHGTLDEVGTPAGWWAGAALK